MTHNNLSEKLRARFFALTGNETRALFPSKGLTFREEAPTHIVIDLYSETTTANMQTNASAFEAWALVLKCWCDVEKITLTWKKPSFDGSSNVRRQHYERFLYRVANFSALCPWFDYVDPDNDLATAKSIISKHLRLNVTGLRADPIIKETMKGEAKLERELLQSDSFAQFFGLNIRNIDRQFPVGLFEGQYSARNRVFSGGKSAIDLIAIDKTTLWIFELKAGGNIQVGALSELLLYTYLMRDVRRRRISFFESSIASNDIRVSETDINGCEAIRSIIIGENIHPLLSRGSIIDTLNEAFLRDEQQLGSPRIKFSVVQLASNEDFRYLAGA